MSRFWGLVGGGRKAGLAVFLLSLALAGSAQAADYEQVPEHFGESGEAAQLERSRAMAINVDGVGGVEAGSLYVVGINGRVLRFSPGKEGEAPQFREAWGWNVGKEEAEEFQRCGPTYASEPRPPHTFATCLPVKGNVVGGEQIGHFNTPSGVSVDQATGDVYVLNIPSVGHREHHLIEVFTATGTPIENESGEDGFGDRGRSTPFPSESIAEGPEKLHEQANSEGDGISVDEDGTVLVIDSDFSGAEGAHESRVMSFEPEHAGDYAHYVYAGQEKDITVPNLTKFLRIALVGSNRIVTSGTGHLIREYPTGGGSTPICSYEVSGGSATGLAANPLTGEVFYIVRGGSQSKLVRLGPCHEATGEFKELQEQVTPSPVTQKVFALALNPSLAWGPLRSEGVLYGADAEDPTNPKGIGDVFAPAKGAGKTLTVSKGGSGAGTVTSSPAAISCGSTCSAEFLEGSTVTLTAAAAGGSTFSGWSGECASTSGNKCEVTMSAARSVTASFEPEGGGTPQRVLAISVSGEGEVKCKFNGGSAGLCTSPKPDGTAVEVIATANFGAQFKEWSPTAGSALPCQGSAAIACSFTLSADTSLTAVFVPATKPKFKLTVSKTGTGSGTVTSTPAGINCGSGAGCEADFEEGTEVTLSQSAASGSEFKEWTGACTGSGACKVTMSAAKAVGAVFNLIPRTMAITKAGTGSGEVKCKIGAGSAEPCAASYPNGTALKVEATANAGSTFAGFSSGTGSAASCSASPCSFTLEANSTLTATFNPAVIPKFKLTVSKSGTGPGTVTSTPARINCGSGAGCEAEFEEGTEVTLAQTPAAGSEFKEWTGACTGSGACKVTMSAAKAVGAVFNLIPRTMAITKAGTGSGEVKCKIGAGSAEPCAASYPNGTALKVEATANAGSTFAGFSSGTGSAASCSASPCSFTIEANSAVTATFNIAVKPKFKLTVSKSGTGAGTVTSTPAGINCGSGAGCEAEFEEGVEVTLSQAAAAGSEFKEWSGCTSEEAGKCKVTMSSAKAIGAVFSPIPRTLSITKAGTGTGEVKCKFGGGSAGACTSPQPNGTAVEVLATANAGSSFAGFSSGTGSASACSTSPCSFVLEANSSLAATFNVIVKPKFKLSVSKTGTGSGTVTSTPAGINCGTGAGCEAEFEEGAEVTLSQAAASGSEFKEWSGCTSEEAGKCKVTMSSAKSVGAVFSPIPRTLSITKAGTGTGEVKCKFNGGSAGACTSPQPNGTAVEVLTTANAGSSFAGFSSGTGSAAACSTSPCAFTIEANSSLTATFNPVVIPKFKLTVTKSGTGSGTVTSTPAGINCGSGAGCEAEYDEGTEVTLNQSASSGSEFKEWTGACSGSGACKVTMSAAKAVGAKFNLIPKPKFKLSVSKTGGGTGTITSSPAGITCGSGTGCEHEYEEGTHVTLTESPGSGSEFAGWQTLQCDESTATTCEITIGSHDEAVGASFVPKAKPKFKLTVSKSGTGQGTVTSTPSGINCGSTCEAEFEEGKEVTLSQSAASGSEFKEWTGACSGSGACKVTMSSAKSVGAKFDLKPNLPEFTLAIELSGNGSGLIACNGGACAERYPEGTEVTLSASALPGSVFGGWSGGGCSGTGECKVTIEADTTIGAKFLAIPSFPPPPPIQRGTALAAAFASYQGDSALIRLLCPQGARCTGTLELFAKLQSPAFAHRRHGPAKATLIGTASFDLAPQSQASVTVKITSARARGILATGRDLSAQLLGTSVHSRIVRLVAPPRGRHRG